jgi:NAD(P)-dependent dehydrogenase (short-subunit alcohol dehydrogenase family)
VANTIDLNLTGVFYCCRAASVRWHQRGLHHQISSLAGIARLPAAPPTTPLNSTNGFSEALMQDLRCKTPGEFSMPGSVDTDFSPGVAARSGKSIQDVAEVVIGLARMPVRTLVSR